MDRLIGLVREAFTDELSPREQFGVLRVEQAWQAARGARRWRSVFRFRTLALAAVAAAAIPSGWLAYRHAARVTYQVVNGAIGGEGRIVDTRAGTTVVFSEGSQLDVAAATRARVASTTPDGGRVVLEDGDVRADIVHRPRTRWTIDAGPYSIRVTGTAFDVRWSATDERLDFRMTRGSVVVTGPLIQDGVTLTAGMRLTARPRAGELAIGDGNDDGRRPGARAEHAPLDEDELRAPAAPDVLPPAEAAPASGATGARNARNAPAPLGPTLRADGVRRLSGAAARKHDEARGWDRQLAEGAFQSVVTEAESAGLEQVLGSATGGDLAALSDAARYTHHSTTAWRALLALRTRFPRAPQTKDAAFFLGGLAENDAAIGARAGAHGSAEENAIDWYDRYLSECPSGRFVGEAWGRKMVLTQRRRGYQAARPIAEEYLLRFPNGPYVAAARKLVQAPE